MAKPIIYRMSLEGAEDVRQKLEEVNAAFHRGEASIDDLRKSQLEASRAASALINQQRVSARLYLAQNQNLLRFSESMRLVSRLTNTALTAFNAFNLAQIAFNTKAAGQVEVINSVRQAERELALAVARGAPEAELAKLKDEVELTRAKAKEFNDELSAQKMQNLFTFGTVIANLGSSFASIVTRSPEIINLFRRIGGAFGGGNVSPGSPPSSGSGGFFSRPSSPGGGFSNATPTFIPTRGGGCLELCQRTQAGLSQSIGAAAASSLGSKVLQGFRSALPYALPVGFAAGVISLLTSIKSNTAQSPVGGPRTDSTSTFALPRFQWPPYPEFKWPPFTFPALPGFDWPELPKFEWPAYNVFHWPPFPPFFFPELPKFEWPPLPEPETPAPTAGQTAPQLIPLLKREDAQQIIDAITEAGTQPGTDKFTSILTLLEQFERDMKEGNLQFGPNALKRRQEAAATAPAVTSQAQGTDSQNATQSIIVGAIGGLAGILIDKILAPLQQSQLARGFGAFKLPNIESFGFEHFGAPQQAFAEEVNIAAPSLNAITSSQDKAGQNTVNALVPSLNTVDSSVDAINYVINSIGTGIITVTAGGFSKTHSLLSTMNTSLQTINSSIKGIRINVNSGGSDSKTSSGRTSIGSSSSGSYKGLTGVAASRAKAAGFAEGGIIKEPTLLMGLTSGGLGIMAERGPEAIMPLTSNTGGGNNVSITINIDGSGDPERVAQYVMGQIKRELRGVGFGT